HADTHAVLTRHYASATEQAAIEAAAYLIAFLAPGATPRPLSARAGKSIRASSAAMVVLPSSEVCPTSSMKTVAESAANNPDRSAKRPGDAALTRDTSLSGTRRCTAVNLRVRPWPSSDTLIV